METKSERTSLGLQLAQVAWVAKDIQIAEKYFREVVGIPNFVKMENLHAEDLEGTYYGKAGNYSFHLYPAYSGGTQIEFIPRLP